MMEKFLDTFFDLVLLAGFTLPYLFGAVAVGVTMYALWSGVNGGLARRILAAMGGAALWAVILWSGWVSGRLSP